MMKKHGLLSSVVISQWPSHCIPFTNLFVDQTLDQLIRELKVAGGITGTTQKLCFEYIFP